MIASHSLEAFGEEIVGKISRLGKAIDTFPNFEIDPPVLCKIMEVVFVDKLFKDVGEADKCIFTTVERSDQVKAFYVKGDKLGDSSREKTVDEEFHKFQGTCGSFNIVQVASAVPSNSDAGAIGVLFLWSEFANHFGVCIFLSSVNMVVLIANHKKCVSSCNSLACTSRVSTNALIYLSKFIGM